MAYLIVRSGLGDIGDRVARTRNTAYVRQLVDDTALVAWLDSTRRSAAEAARIQPEYGGPIVVPTTGDDDRGRASYALTSLALGGAVLAAGGVNFMAPSRTAGWLGPLAGSAALASGASRLDDGGGTKQVAVGHGRRRGGDRLRRPRPAGLTSVAAERPGHAGGPGEPERGPASRPRARCDDQAGAAGVRRSVQCVAPRDAGARERLIERP